MIAPEKPVLLDVNGLSVSFATDRGMVKAIRDVSFNVREGEILSIVGESGSGKSVTLLSLLGLHDAKTTRVDGVVAFRGRRILELPANDLRRIRGKEIGLISQDPMTALTPVYTIGSQIAEQIRAHEAVSARAARKRAIELLGEVGLSNPVEAVDRYPHQLSGGMRQRAVIAMALSCNPALLVADEPTTALDVTVQAQVLDLLLRLRKDFGSAIILITHDMGVVSEIADRVAVMYAGRIVERGETEAMFASPLHPYSWGLMASIPPLTGQRLARLKSIPGMPPTPETIGEGCGFAPRCAFARPLCLERPPLRRVGEQAALCVLEEPERSLLRRSVLTPEELA
ncbi:putative ABC transporter ATP-binding protein [Agrobacterium rubi TR3 = NBRC 13261]|uniref:Putative ABC transporter ATP-binding protein n=1 Tax=Agrobacterium rubi TR3 = NBRC 13261 TaxID=1368415 RepID=A0A081CZ48_9HYPH|nr:ABC transporter ATP-binding protein [Agrobacterium rubi]MBP1880259.1 peptide/nickel transport system ATP-binding protein [Agrobacterium rubi]GAK71944.1 putative ABC transporter ATP-binding protein [Agrobacterium rubi TR3 = NBRC 13261]